MHDWLKVWVIKSVSGRYFKLHKLTWNSSRPFSTRTEFVLQWGSLVEAQQFGGGDYTSYEQGRAYANQHAGYASLVEIEIKELPVKGDSTQG